MEDKKKNTVPEYTRKAIERYNQTKDHITLSLPKGTKEQIKNKIGNKSLNSYILELIENDLQQ